MRPNTVMDWVCATGGKSSCWHRRDSAQPRLSIRPAVKSALCTDDNENQIIEPYVIILYISLCFVPMKTISWPTR